MRALFNFQLAREGVAANLLRAFLTGLGIMFGVGAVIAMLAIGSGAKQALLEQMKLIGTNNIVIKSIVPEAEESDNSNTKNAWSPGLTLNDVNNITQHIPSVEKVSPELVFKTKIQGHGKLIDGKCIGTDNAFFDMNNLLLVQGRHFHFIEAEHGKAVCIIGHNVKVKLFGTEKAIGQKIKCKNVWLTVVGILTKRQASSESLEKLGIRDYNDDIYVPINTALLRIKNRAFVSRRNIGRDNENNTLENYHQLDRLVIRVKDSKYLQSTANVVGRILKRRHKEVVDYEIEVPELLLKQQQKTQDTFNWVLAAIAAISLLVGGIGIMNIMLASVLERIKEIGVRRSLGANRTDIILQFLFEAVFISLLGGLFGIALGIGAAKLIAVMADIPTVISTWSIVLSFGVAAAVGLVFGIFPARKAAKEDPIKALRSD